MIEIQVNGEARTSADGASLSDLIADLGLDPALVAVELNRVLVPKSKRDETLLAGGDRVELVTLVGGG